MKLNKLLIEVSGNINKFILKCNLKNINLLKVKYISYKKILVTIYESDFDKINKLNFDIKIINRFGLIKIKYIIRKYKIQLISFCFGIILLLFLSNIIFKIDIECDNNNLKELIKKELINYDIDIYKFKRNYKTYNNIKNKIQYKYNKNIEWLEIKNDGVLVKVYVIEKKIKNNKISNNKYEIIAKKNGVIKDVIVNKGELVVERENYVKKGDILISGNIYLNDELKDTVSASGKVYASVWYKVRCEYPLNYQEKKLINKKNIFYIGFDNIKLKINDKLTKLNIGIKSVYKYNYINNKYSINKAKSLAVLESRKQIELKLSKDEHIISQKTLNFDIKGSRIIVDTFFSVYEEIGEKRIIEEMN